VRVRWVLCAALAAADCRGSALGSGSQDRQVSAAAANDVAAAADSGTPAVSASNPGACLPPDSSAVRLLSPQSGASVTSSRARFRWTGGTGPYQLQVCADRACKTVLIQAASSGNEISLAQAIPPGYWFWRVQAAAGSASHWTSSWEMRVRRRFAGYAPIGNTSVSGFSDYNGDGYPDVAVFGATPMIYSGGPDGLVADRVVPSKPNASTPMMLIEPQNDLNGDGFTDLSSTAVAAVSGDSRSGYAAHVQFGASNGLSSLDAFIAATNGIYNPTGLGDFDGDGFGDLVMQARYGADLILGCAPAPPKGAWAELRCGNCQLQQVATGDFNGDGRTDFVFADSGGINLYMGNRDGATWRAIAGTSGLSVIDFNYDGYSDLAFQDPSGAPKAYEGGPAGLSSTLSTSPQPLPFALIGDFDGDGYWDTVGAGSSPPGPTATVVYGAVSGWGAPPTRTTTIGQSTTASTATVVDVNADGYDDVVVQQPGQTIMYWYAGSSTGLATVPTRVLTH